MLSSTNGLLKHPITQGILASDRHEIRRAEKLSSPGIRRQQDRHAIHLPRRRMRRDGQGMEELQSADHPVEAVQGAEVA